MSNQTVLLVDDSELLLEMAAFQLQASGLDVVTASDLTTLRTRLASSDVGLVVLDVQMPDVSPEELFAALGNNEAPVWLFSALDEEQLGARAATVGADDYVCKDQGFEELTRRAKALFER